MSENCHPSRPGIPTNKYDGESLEGTIFNTAEFFALLLCKIDKGRVSPDRGLVTEIWHKIA